MSPLQWSDVILRNESVELVRVGHVVLCPLLNESNDTEDGRLFAVVSSNWKSLMPSLQLSHLVDGEYQSRLKVK